MDNQRFTKPLLRHYLTLLLPAAAVLAGWALYKNVAGTPAPMAPAVVGPVAFIGAAACALALPILARARFVKRVADWQSVPGEAFLAFEKVLLTTALASVYFAALGYVCTIGLFHFGGAFLAALYAAYYYYPTEERVKSEMRLFRVEGKEEGGSDDAS